MTARRTTDALMSASSSHRARSAHESLGPVRFSDLRAHLARGAVIVVAPALELLEAAAALAKDDRASVAGWIEHGLLRKPSTQEIARWEARHDDVAVTVVVQPYVLLQELPSANPERLD